ncbi:putative ribonuclease H-like domain, reverse transcriptase zinc-binding domain-containing protein [Senna tora]|uniref:Putative ribonuclease H-like domain, reverse transcriptase zinc-binding domain-containing protein n=1 Tax=Senna tora TaxID=362788 RepID=A0A835C8C1_9FABA|nr:putative ribonuclease H-like domain, reverse transcriptase zinc-binding domain-containing protein [Senna tora]
MSTNIWHDPWVPGLGQHVLDRFLVQDEEFKWVRELINEQREWRWECVRRLFLEDVVQRLRRIHLEARGGDDCWSWSEYCWCVRDDFWKRLWKLPIMPKYKSFIWRVCLDILPACVALKKGSERCGERSRFDFGGRRYIGSVLEWLNVEGESGDRINGVSRASSLWDEFGCVENLQRHVPRGNKKWRWEKPATNRFASLPRCRDLPNEGGILVVCGVIITVVPCCFYRVHPNFLMSPSC